MSDLDESSEAEAEAEEKKALTPEQFAVCRKGETEAPFSGRYVDCKEDGMYACVCCGQELFDSNTKYDSGSGWPSFFAAISSERIQFQRDEDLGVLRIEARCSRCRAHLGHLFEDGPRPTGARYCINSVALELRPRAPGPPGEASEEDSPKS